MDKDENIRSKFAIFLEKIRQKYPNAYAKWTPEEEQILKKEYLKFTKKTSDSFQRSPGAIRARLRKLFKRKLI